MPKHYTVSDGNMVLFLWPAEEGGYTITSPLDPALITEAETIEEAFVMAYDATECLREARAKRADASAGVTAPSKVASRRSKGRRPIRSPD